MISVIIAPIVPDLFPARPWSQTKTAPTLAPAKINPIIEYLSLHHRSEISRWTIISSIEPDHGGPRFELRKRRAEIFRQLDELIRSGKIEKVDRHRVRLRTSC